MRTRVLRRRRPVSYALLAVVLAVTAATLPYRGPESAASPEESYRTPVTARHVTDLDTGWRFHKGAAAGAERPGYDDSGWRPVTVPHTWNGRDGEDGGNSYYRGVGWYRTTVVIPGRDHHRRVFLQFDGANLVTDVWVNGREAGRHAGGYAAFRFDVTDLVTPGRRALVAVRVDNAVDPDVPPLQGDFTMFGGLVRDVHLLVTAPVHVDALDYGGPGVYVRQPAVTPTRADLDVTTRVTNDTTRAAAVTVDAVVTDARNHVVARASRGVDVAAGATVPVAQALTVPRPRLWNGRADPYLYRVHAVIRHDGRVVDATGVPLGIRTVTIDPDRGTLLNGEPVDVHGVNLHAMWPGKGYAISDSDIDRDFAMIEELGATAIRLAHYQHPQRIYDLSDRAGMLLWTEIPLLGSLTASDAFFANARQQLIELIRQNQHHPSVVVWGLGNELYTNSEDANRLLASLAQTAAEADPERPSSYAFCCFDEGDPLAEHADTIGHNLYFGWYYGDFADMGEWADRMHATFLTRRISVSEYGAGASVVHQEDPPTQPDPAGEFHPEQWQARYHEGNWRELRTREFLWGTFVWLMFDFASDGRDEGDRPGLNDKGLVTADRTIKKDAFYWYQASWSDRPVVHITGGRDTPRFAATTDVRVYANTDRVHLTVNGESLGARAPDDHVARWAGVRLEAGSNTVVATGGGRTDRVTWYVDPAPPATSVDVNATDPHASDGRVFLAGGRVYREGTFGYRFPVVNGTYDVDLTFAEPRWTADGGRIFNVNAERKRAIQGLDIHREVGHDTTLHKHLTVQVADGVLDLEFVPQVGDAIVSAISATRRTP